MTLAKGFLLGFLGCAGGCLVAGILVVVMLTVAFAACATVVPLAILSTHVEAVELELAESLPADVLETLAREASTDGTQSGRRSGFRLWARDGRRAWLALEPSQDNGTRRRVERAIERLESNGKIQSGSIRIVGFVKRSPGLFQVNFREWDSSDSEFGLDTHRSKR